MSTEPQNVNDPKTLGELSEDEQALIRARRAGEKRAAARLTGKRGAPEGWSYEQRAACAILGRLALEGVINERELLVDPPTDNYFTSVVEAVGETLLDSLHILGCPDTLSLSEILDYATTYEVHRRYRDEQDGAS